MQRAQMPGMRQAPMPGMRQVPMPGMPQARCRGCRRLRCRGCSRSLCRVCSRSDAGDAAGPYAGYAAGPDAGDAAGPGAWFAAGCPSGHGADAYDGPFGDTGSAEERTADRLFYNFMITLASGCGRPAAHLERQGRRNEALRHVPGTVHRTYGHRLAADTPAAFRGAGVLLRRTQARRAQRTARGRGLPRHPFCDAAEAAHQPDDRDHHR